MTATIQYVDSSTLVLTDQYITDYIKLTGDQRRPWYFIDSQILPLSPENRTIVDAYALEVITDRHLKEADQVMFALTGGF